MLLAGTAPAPVAALILSHDARARPFSPRSPSPPPPPLPFPPSPQSGKGKAPAAKGKAAPVATKGKAAPAKAAPAGKTADPLHPAAPKNFRVGNSIQPKRNLSRFVRWPRNVRVQRQKKVLYERLKVPPSINQFRKPLDRAEASPLLRLLSKYKPETVKEKKARLEKAAADKAAGKAVNAGPAPVVLKFGLNHITTLIEEKKAKLVVIASDVDPIELVVWLPALCRKMGIPYAIVNNKGLLGQLVHQKKAAVVALTGVKAEDQVGLDKVIETAKAKFADNVDLRRKWGGGIMGLKTQKRLEKREKMLQAELAKRAAL